VTPIAVNEHLAHLLTIQGGLLDAYLEQNLGARYAYVAIVFELAPGARLRAVTNLRDVLAARAILQDCAWSTARAFYGDVVELDRVPQLVEAEPVVLSEGE